MREYVESGYKSAEELAMRLNLNIAQAMEWFEVNKFIATFGIQTLDFILTRPTKALKCLKLRNEGTMREVAPGDVRSLLKSRLSDHAPLVADFATRCNR